MTTIPNHEDKNEKWNIIGRLVEKCGTHEDKIAWMLCRAEKAEENIKALGGIEQIKRNLKNKIKKEKKIKGAQRKEKRIVFVVFSVVIVVVSYIVFKLLGAL